MPVFIQCSQCGRKLRVQDDLVGKPVKCPACNVKFLARAIQASQPALAGAAAPAKPAAPPAKPAAPKPRAVEPQDLLDGPRRESAPVVRTLDDDEVEVRARRNGEARQ